MENNARTLADHNNDAAALREAIAFIAPSLDLVPLIIAADVLENDRSVYRLMDENGAYDFGTVTKTRAMWKLETPDRCVFRAKNADLIALRACPKKFV